MPAPSRYDRALLREASDRHEKDLSRLVDRHRDGTPISDKEHQDSRATIAAMVVIGAQRQKLFEDEWEELVAKIEARLPSEEMNEDMRTFFKGRRAWALVGQSLKSAAVWLAALLTVFFALRTIGADIVKSLIGDSKP